MHPTRLPTAMAIATSLALAALLELLGGWNPWLFGLASAASSFVLWGAIRERGALRWALALFLLADLVAASGLAVVHMRDAEHWFQAAIEAQDEGVGRASDALVALRDELELRAGQALEGRLSLEEVARPVRLGESELELAVSRWRDDRLIEWAGPVPGPARPPLADRPLLVDHGFRRTLAISATDSVSGEIAWVDVGLGYSRDLFARLALGDAAATPLSRLARLDVQLRAEYPFGPLDEGYRVVSIPIDVSWAWLELETPSASLMKSRALDGARRPLALLLWPTLLVGLVLGLRRQWGRGDARALLLAVILLAFRTLIARAQLLERSIGEGTDPLPLVLEPGYFILGIFGGLGDHVLGLLLTSVVLLIAVGAMLPGLLRGVERLPAALGWPLLGLATFGTTYLAQWLQESAVRNANPKLVGLDAPFLTAPFLLLHCALFILLLAPTVFLVGAWARQLKDAKRWWEAIAAGLVLFGLTRWAGQATALALAGALLPLLALAIARPLREPSFARRVFAALIALLWIAGLQSQGLLAEYRELKEGVARQEAEQRIDPSQNWREFFLETVLEELAEEEDLIDRLVDPLADRSNLAFEIWVTTNLGKVGYGTQVLVTDQAGGRLSEFSLGIPREPPLPGSRINPADSLQGTFESLVLPRLGGGHIFRGVLDLQEMRPGASAGAVVLEMYSQPGESLMEAPEIGPLALGLPQGQGLGPRREFEEPVTPIDAASLVSAELPEVGRWKAMRVDGEMLDVLRLPTADGRDLLFSFRLETAGARLLDLGRLALLYLALGALLLLLLWISARLLPVLRPVQTALIGETGFQERLVGVLVIVVLLPVIGTGIFHEQRASREQLRDHREEVVQRLESALELLGQRVDEIAMALIGGDYVQDILLAGNTIARRDLGPFEQSQLIIFGGNGELLLDESLRDFSVEEAAAFRVQLDDRELRLEVDRSGWYLGRSYSWPTADGDATIYLRRELSDSELRELAAVVGADLTLYEGPWAVLSSQDFLYRAGLRSPVLPHEVAPLLRGAGPIRPVSFEASGDLRIATGFARLPALNGGTSGILSARLFARANEAAREQRRAQLYLLGLSSLAFMLALVLGLVLAARVVVPLRRLAVATQRVGGGEFETVLPEGGDDELGQLLRGFNQMTQQLRHGQARLAERQNFLEAVMGNLTAGVMVMDGDRSVVEDNSAARAWPAVAREALLDRLLELGPPDHPANGERSVPGLEGRRTLRWVSTPIEQEDGQAGWLIVFDDVTELIDSRRLQLYAQMARQVAHEVKNPLTPIQLAAQMLRQAVQDRHPRASEIVNEQVAHIEGQVSRLRDIASEFSLLGRDEALEVEEVALQPLLEEVVAFYPSLDGRHRIERRVEGEPVALANREALLKVLTNLVGNSLQAMDGEGDIELVAGLSGGRVELRVRDHGPGISPEVEERLFEPYFSTKSTGTGLGLIICRNLIEKMGGRIDLANRGDGGGAEARIELPRPRSQAPESPGDA